MEIGKKERKSALFFIYACIYGFFFVTLRAFCELR